MINQTIEALLLKHKTAIGRDFDRYRNHVYRVFLNCLLLDAEEVNIEKYAIAAVYHDIGIWTDHTFDYLDPSIEHVKNYLTETKKPDWIEEVSLMIYWHHKISVYRGRHEKLVENFRKADWIDVSLGLLTFTVNRKVIRNNQREFPNRGFHWFLIQATVKNFFRQPLNPLPMFRR